MQKKVTAKNAPPPRTKWHVFCGIPTFLASLFLWLVHLSSLGSSDFTHLSPPHLPCSPGAPQALCDLQSCSSCAVCGFPSLPRLLYFLLPTNPPCSHCQSSLRALFPPTSCGLCALDVSTVSSSCLQSPTHLLPAITKWNNPAGRRMGRTLQSGPVLPLFLSSLPCRPSTPGMLMTTC